MKRREIVIDASIARSAGNLDAKKPTSTHCRNFLQAVLEICHKAVFTQDIHREWRKHNSNFARKWESSMKARKKRIFLKESDIKKLSKKSLQKIASSEDSKAISKDLHLLEAALSTDCLIASRDEEMRTILTINKEDLIELGSITWVNPCNDEENVIQWLKDGAKTERKRLFA